MPAGGPGRMVGGVRQALPAEVRGGESPGRPSARELALGREPGPGGALGRDVLAPARPRRAGVALEAPGGAFSWRRALAHLGTGVWRQGRDMVRSMIAHPLMALASVGLVAGAVAAAPLVGLSSVAAGATLTLGFAVWGGIGMLRGAMRARAHHRAGRHREAEAAFEGVGRGAFDVGAVVLPLAAGKVVGAISRTERGAALVAAVADSAPARALGSAGSAVASWGPIRALRAARARAADLPETGLRRAVAESAPVKGLNALFGQRVWLRPREGASRIELDAALARMELEGTALLHARFSAVRPGLFRGGAPTSVQDFAFLVRKHEIKTIVNFLVPENPKELGLLRYEQEIAAQLGVKVVNLPLPGGVDPSAATVAEFLRILRAPERGPVYMHCRIGRDRTGTMAAVARMELDGFSPEAAYAEMRAFGFEPHGPLDFRYLRDFVLRYEPQGLPHRPTLLERARALLTGKAQI